MGTRGHVLAALLEEMMDVRGSACFEDCETQFRYSRYIRQDSVEAPVLLGTVTTYVLWKAERRWKARDGGVLFGGEEDDEYRFSCMMWVDN